MAQLAEELELEEILGEGGNIADVIADFAPRQSQLAMAQLIMDAILNGESQVIEASTGIGKSFAYLVPAFLLPQRFVISTGTRNLQDQLFTKDIPLLQKAIVSSKRVALLKGRSNYCCPYRIGRNRNQPRFRNAQSAGIFNALAEWSEHTETGDISEFSALPENDSLWFYATSTADNCLGSECPEISRCFVAKARKQAIEADIVVINHHLYFSDQALKQDGFGEILPQADVVVFDEAHQLPDIASLFFGSQVSQRQINRLTRDCQEAELAEAGDSRQLEKLGDAADKAAADFMIDLQGFADRGDWEQVKNAAKLQRAVGSLQQALADLEDALATMAPRGRELGNCHKRLKTLQHDFELFLDGSANRVSWYERNNRSFRLATSPVEVSQEFAGQLHSAAAHSHIFTSATISTQGTFDYFNRRLGLSDIATTQFDSPFDYQKQALLYLPDDLPDPSESQFVNAFHRRCLALLEASDGHCFILFTSYRMLMLTAEFLRDNSDFPLFVQGEYQRNDLLERYRQQPRAVLLGTSSFWEGVDVKGEQLRCVIIDKLPFKSPADPVYRRRIQLANEQGGNAFNDIQVPEAIIGLRQGIGRLIRDQADRGVVVICDNRIKRKFYGKKMLASLPPYPLTTELKDVEDFFQHYAE